MFKHLQYMEPPSCGDPDIRVIHYRANHLQAIFLFFLCSRVYCWCSGMEKGYGMAVSHVYVYIYICFDCDVIVAAMDGVSTHIMGMTAGAGRIRLWATPSQALLHVAMAVL